jgi:hypothetical protein
MGLQVQWMASSRQLKKSAKQPTECEHSVHCFLCLSRFSAIEFIPKRSNSESRILPGHLMSSTRPCKGNDQNSGGNTDGFFTTMFPCMHHSLSQLQYKKPNSCGSRATLQLRSLYQQNFFLTKTEH